MQIPINLSKSVCRTISAGMCKMSDANNIPIINNQQYTAIFVINDNKKQTPRSGNPQTLARADSGGAIWIDGYNIAVHRESVTTLKTNTDTSNIYFINYPPNRNQPLQ